MRVSDVMSDLTAAKVEWDQYLANPRFVRKNSVITWHGYEKLWLGNSIRSEEFLELVDKGQYSLQIVEDGSILQLMYEFDESGENVLKASLAFYGAPENIEPEESEPQMVEDELADVPGEGPATPAGFCSGMTTNRWLRIDFDSSGNTSVIHGGCHMHVGGLPSSRFLVRGLPGPAQFIEWVFSLFYPDTYRQHRLDGDGQFSDIAKLVNANRHFVVFGDHDSYKYMTHVVIPIL